MIPELREIWVRRNLVFQLVLRDLKLRYGRFKFGYLWAFLSPILTAGVFYLAFAVILKVKIAEAPFLLYLMSGTFTWAFFQGSINSSITSLLEAKNLIRETNFVHYLIPVSIVLANGIIFLATLLVLAGLAGILLKGLPLVIIFLPLVLAIHLALSAGLAVIFSIIYVKYRDIKYILEFILNLLLYLTPAFYSLSHVKATFHPLLFTAYLYNPFVGILNFYRLLILKGFYKFVQNEINIVNLFILPGCFAVLSLYLAFRFYNQHKGAINDYLSY